MNKNMNKNLNEILDELFEGLKEILHTEEFACHAIKNGRLYPVYKNDTSDIGLQAWKDFHAENGIYIDTNELLKEVVDTKKAVAVNDTVADGTRNYSCFIQFNIKANYVIPLLKNDEVVAFIVIPVLGHPYDYTKEKREACENLVKKYNNKIVSHKFY